MPGSSWSDQIFSGRTERWTSAPAGSRPARLPCRWRRREPHAAVLDHAGQRVGQPDEARHERSRWMLVDLLWRAALLDQAALHHRDPVGHRERLLLVMCHVQERDSDLALNALQLPLHLLSQFQVERAERLVQEQRLRAVHERPRQRHALLLAARQLWRPGLAALAAAPPARAPRPRAGGSRPSRPFAAWGRRRRCPPC